MNKLKRLIILALLLMPVLLSPTQSLAQDQPPIYYRITHFPAGDICNWPGGLFPYDVTGAPMQTEVNVTPENIWLYYVSAPGMWRRMSAWNPNGFSGQSVDTFPDFGAYQLAPHTPILIEIELYPETTPYYNPYFQRYEYYPSGGLAYYQYLEIDCSTGAIIDSGETFFN